MKNNNTNLSTKLRDAPDSAGGIIIVVHIHISLSLNRILAHNRSYNHKPTSKSGYVLIFIAIGFKHTLELNKSNFDTLG